MSAAGPSLAGRLLGLCDEEPPLKAVGSPRPPSAGETEKYVLSTADGYEIEMVAMPAPGVEGSWSLCVSSQVGCARACTCIRARAGLEPQRPPGWLAAAGL